MVPLVQEDWVKSLAPKFFAAVDKAEEDAIKAETDGKNPFWPRYELTEYRDGKVVIVPTDEITFSSTKALFSTLRVANHKYVATPIEETPETVLLSMVIPVELLAEDMQGLWKRVCMRNRMDVKQLSYVKLGDFKDRKKKKVCFRATAPAVAAIRAADGGTSRRACHLAVRSTQIEVWYKQRPLCKFSDEELVWERRV